MSVERERQALELLDQALGLTAAERAAFLDRECDDPDVRRRVEELLDDDTGSDPDRDGLARPIFDVHCADPYVGRRIGDYRLVEVLGRGGMGTVYLAEREDFDQQVALKLIRRGLDADPQLIRRFHNERQILARLDHRYIARLLDGGTTDDHLPYFVMEQVEGEPIHRYCRSQGLGIAERLRLFRKVCEAVQSAHRSLVVHRDLKPGNVLITTDGEPKLLDFGIAKLLDDELAARPVATIPGQGPMTPRYASPEQIRLEPITTASDVYSLGVLLFELLTGQSPYDTPDDSAATVGKAVCEQEPLAPSTAVRKRASEDPALPPADALRKRLSGDLDSIVLKALQKRPEDRYSSVEALGADLERHLAGHPVTAREGTWAYRLGKGIRRHRLAVAVVSAFVLLSLGLGFTSFRMQLEQGRARLEQARAAEALARTEELVEFLKIFLGRADPDAPVGERQIAIDFLIWAEKSLDSVEDLASEAELAGELAKLFAKQGAYEDGLRLAERALEAARELHLGDHSEVATRLANRGNLRSKLGSYDEAEMDLAAALKMRQDLGEKGAALFKVRSSLARVKSYRAKYLEAAEIYQDVLAGRLELYGLDDERIARTRRSLAANLFALDRLDDAESELREALRVRETLKGPDHTSVASVLHLLGNVLAAQGAADEAVGLLRRALEIRESRFVADHPDVAASRTSLAVVLIPSATEEAELQLDLARESLLRTDPDGVELAETDSARGALLTYLGRFDEAKWVLCDARSRLVDRRPAESHPVRVTDRRLSDLQRRWGRYDPCPPTSPTDDPSAPETTP